MKQMADKGVNQQALEQSAELYRRAMRKATMNGASPTEALYNDKPLADFYNREAGGLLANFYTPSGSLRQGIQSPERTQIEDDRKTHFLWSLVSASADSDPLNLGR